MGADPGGLMGGDNTTILQQFVAQTGVTFPVGIDVNFTYRDYRVGTGISPFPLDVIVDQNGTIAYVKREYDPDAMTQVIEGLLP